MWLSGCKSVCVFVWLCANPRKDFLPVQSVHGSSVGVFKPGDVKTAAQREREEREI